MKKILTQLKEYWPIITFVFAGIAVIVRLVVGVYVTDIAMEAVKSDAAKLYVQGIIAAEMLKAGTPTDATITAVNGTLELHGSQITELDADVTLTQQQLRDVANILMKPPGQ